MQKLGAKYIVLFSVLINQGLAAQQVELNETVAIKEMVDQWVVINLKSATLEGWRVMIASSTDRFQIQEEKARFLALYPHIPCDWYHEKPYYKLKAGAFAHSWEARKLISFISGDFKGAYPILDKKIKPIDFLSIGTE
jgi:hypothetical protein